MTETKTDIPDLFREPAFSAFAEKLKQCRTSSYNAWEAIVWHVVAAHERSARFHHLTLSDMQIWRQSLFPVPYQIAGPFHWEEQKRHCLCTYADEDDKKQQERIETALRYADKSKDAMAKLQAARANIRKIEEQHLQRVAEEDLDRYPMTAFDYRDHALRAGVERVPIQLMSEHGGIDWERLVHAEDETIFRGVMLFVPVMYLCPRPRDLPEYKATFNYATIACDPMPRRKRELWLERVLRCKMQEKPFRLEQVIELSLDTTKASAAE